MKKVLFTATLDSHILCFHIPYLKWFKEQGYEVHVATNGKENIPYCDKKHIITFERNPIKFENLKAIKDLKKIINDEQYDIIHCNTPVGSVITRIAAIKARKNGTKVIYTAHGFHFYKGAPLLNWVLYYPIEKIMSRYTDCLITINEEDYKIAKKKFKKIKEIKKVPGVGFNTEKFNSDVTEKEKNFLKESLNIKDEKVLTYIAELNKNKNQIFLINVIEKLIQENKKIKLLLVGDGEYKEHYLQAIEKKKLKNNIILLGKRDDILQILSITDIYVASSIREGLPVNIMEAMYMKLPIVAFDNRGHRELISNNINGFIINDEDMMKKRIIEIINNKELNEEFIKNNNEIINKYTIKNVLEIMTDIYKNI